MGKTTAQKGAHVVKDGMRHKDVYATAVGDTTKAYFLNKEQKRISLHITLNENCICQKLIYEGTFLFCGHLHL